MTAVLRKFFHFVKAANKRRVVKARRARVAGYDLSARRDFSKPECASRVLLVTTAEGWGDTLYVLGLCERLNMLLAHSPVVSPGSSEHASKRRNTIFLHDGDNQVARNSSKPIEDYPEPTRRIITVSINDVFARHGICAKFFFTEQRRKESFAFKTDGSYCTPQEVRQYMKKADGLQTDTKTGEYFLNGEPVSIDNLFKGLLRDDPKKCQPSPDAAEATASRKETERKKEEKEKTALDAVKLKTVRSRFGLRAVETDGPLTASFLRYAQYLRFASLLLKNHWEARFAGLYASIPAYFISNTDKAFDVYVSEKLADETSAEFPELSADMHRKVFDDVFKAVAMAKKSRILKSKPGRNPLKRALNIQRIVLSFAPTSAPCNGTVTLPLFDGMHWTPTQVALSADDWAAYSKHFVYPAGEPVKLRLFGQKCVIDLPGTKVTADNSQPKVPASPGKKPRTERFDKACYIKGSGYYNCRIDADPAAVKATIESYSQTADVFLPYFLYPDEELLADAPALPTNRKSLTQYIGKLLAKYLAGAIPKKMLENSELLLNAAADARDEAVRFQKKTERWEASRAKAIAKAEAKAKEEAEKKALSEITDPNRQPEPPLADEINEILEKADKNAPAAPKTCSAVPLLGDVLPEMPVMPEEVKEENRQTKPKKKPAAKRSRKAGRKPAGSQKNDWNLGKAALKLLVSNTGWTEVPVTLAADDWKLVTEMPHIFRLDRVRLIMPGNKPMLSIQFR